jgi:purine-binding chemotaxis protein CheW
MLHGEMEEEDTTKDLYLSFIVDDDEYAISVTSVIEIMPLTPITVVPETPDYVRGIMNLRGDIVPVIEIRRRFMKPDREFDDNTCIIIIKYEDYILGLIVDRVVGVYTITEEYVSEPPKAKLSHSNMFVKNIGKTHDGLKLLLDLDRLIAQG